MTDEFTKRTLRLSLRTLAYLEPRLTRDELHECSENIADQLYAARFLPDRELCADVKRALDNCVPDYCTRLLALLDGDHGAWWQRGKHSGAPERDGGE